MSTMARATYKITDPAIVDAYTAAREAQKEWHVRAAAFVETLPNVKGYTRRGGFTAEETGLCLQLEDQDGPIPDGFRYVKTRGQVEPKLHKAGEYARELYAPFKESPPQPVHALRDAHVPTFVFDRHHSGVYTIGHFMFYSTIYVSYGQPLEDKDLERCPALVPIKESEYVLAKEALEDEEKNS